MPKSDHRYVNFSQEHELEYITDLYEDGAKVKLALIDLEETKGSRNMTHNEVYDYLKDKGFVTAFAQR